jgi:signal transduction histidine kinase
MLNFVGLQFELLLSSIQRALWSISEPNPIFFILYVRTRVAMISPNQKPHLASDPALSTSQREQQRLDALAQSGLLETDRVSIFDEATQTAAHFLSVPICVLGVMDGDRHWFKSAVGLSRIGLMNQLAASRQLSRSDSFCHQVVERRRPLIIPDTTADPATANSVLLQEYGIQAYLSVPLLDGQGQCLGTLAVMELAPRQFSPKDIAFLELMARWSMSEYERDRLTHAHFARRGPEGFSVSPATPGRLLDAGREVSSPPYMGDLLLLKSDLLTQMTQELRTPLTSVLGMTSVLKREIYGALTEKQHEYIDVVHSSGQYLLSLVNEILEIGSVETDYSSLDLMPVDIEMLCQQAIRTLEQAAHRRENEIQLTVEPGNRIWCLDKGKIRQMLYHLMFNLIQTSNPGSIVRVHVSRKQQQLQLMIWTSHPWLGDGLPQETYATPKPDLSQESYGLGRLSQGVLPAGDRLQPTHQNSGERSSPNPADSIVRCSDRQELGLKLSQRLAALHGGEIKIQGSATTGLHYLVLLPQLSTNSGPISAGTNSGTSSASPA